MNLSKFLATTFLTLVLSNSATYATNTFDPDNDYDQAVANSLQPKQITLEQFRSFLGIDAVSTEEHPKIQRYSRKRKAPEERAVEESARDEKYNRHNLQSSTKRKKTHTSPEGMTDPQDQSLTTSITTSKQEDTALEISQIQPTQNNGLPLGAVAMARDGIQNYTSNLTFTFNSSSTHINGQLVQSNFEVAEVRTVNGLTTFNHILANQRNDGSGPQSKFQIISGRTAAAEILPILGSTRQLYNAQPFMQGALPINIGVFNTGRT